MPGFKQFITRTVSVLLALVLMSAYPMPALAETKPPVCPTVNGTTAPTGAAAVTFTYNKDKCLWENDYYSWDPVTKIYSPKFAQPYTYNSTTGKYDAPAWFYSSATGKYQPATISVTSPPAGATVIGGPPPPVNTISGTGSGSSNAINTATGGGSNTIAKTGADSSNTINNTPASSQKLTNQNGVTVNNLLDSKAVSGNAAINMNTAAGNATSGNAAGAANVINLLQSNTNLQGNVATFTYDIYGNVQGDLMLNPSQLSSVNSNGRPNNLTVNSSTGAAINNDIALNAKSGDATVSQNTAAGNATSGTATAVANIINVINSIISSGQSFVGTINIYGNFDGDILLPQDTLNKLLAANYPTVNAAVNPDGSVSVINNTGANSANTITNNGSPSTDINNKNTTGISNNVNLTAASGKALVDKNTLAGNATTGNASTNLVLLNLTGQQIICGNALLVFVNVLGNWVGMIVNAPGATSAALGGGTCTTSAIGSGNTTINNTTNNTINNNVKLAAASGDATVSMNTKAGNATTGDAKAAANIANIANSNLSFSSWFGILFINVFGRWHGSFGLNTSAGNKTAVTTSRSPDGTNSNVKVFRFEPKTSNSGHTTFFAPAGAPAGGSNSITNTGANSHNAILASASTGKPSGPAGPFAPQGRKVNLYAAVGSLIFLAGVMGAEQVASRRKNSAKRAAARLDAITVQPLKR